jgi:hypothetical protein
MTSMVFIGFQPGWGSAGQAAFRPPGSRGEGAEVAAFVLFTRPLATTMLAITLTVMVLPAIVSPVKRLLGTVGEETGA